MDGMDTEYFQVNSPCTGRVQPTPMSKFSEKLGTQQRTNRGTRREENTGKEDV